MYLLLLLLLLRFNIGLIKRDILETRARISWMSLCTSKPRVRSMFLLVQLFSITDQPLDFRPALLQPLNGANAEHRRHSMATCPV